MRIKEKLNQHRRDFTAIYQCSHCGHELKADGYDDGYFHKEVVPKMECPECKQIAPDSYKPLATKYKDGVQL